MKTTLVYTEKEYDKFYSFITFLNRLSTEMDDATELTNERENIIDKTKDLITEIMDFFPVEEGADEE